MQAMRLQHTAAVVVDVEQNTRKDAADARSFPFEQHQQQPASLQVSFPD
jgi:hypothetical protein